MSKLETTVQVHFGPQPNYAFSNHPTFGLCKLNENSTICHNKIERTTHIPNEISPKDYNTYYFCENHLQEMLHNNEMIVRLQQSPSGLVSLEYPWYRLWREFGFYGTNGSIDILRYE